MKSVPSHAVPAIAAVPEIVRPLVDQCAVWCVKHARKIEREDQACPDCAAGLPGTSPMHTALDTRSVFWAHVDACRNCTDKYGHALSPLCPVGALLFQEIELSGATP